MGMPIGIIERIRSGLVRFSFRLEWFFPQFIKLFLNRKLKEYKEKGAITDYKVGAKRKGKHHYSFEINLFLEIGEGGEKYG